MRTKENRKSVDEKLLLPFGALVLGWALSELTHYLEARRQVRYAAGRALAELLEVRHYLRGIEFVFAELRRLLPLPPHDALQGMTWLEQLMPPDPHLPDRYNAALTELAATSPLLAYQLRSKEQLPLLLTKLRAAALADPTAAQLAIEADRFLRAEGLGPLEEAISHLAWRHGFGTWFRTRVKLKRPPVDLKEYQDAVARYVKALSAPITTRAPNIGVHPTPGATSTAGPGS